MIAPGGLHMCVHAARGAPATPASPLGALRARVMQPACRHTAATHLLVGFADQLLKGVHLGRRRRGRVLGERLCGLDHLCAGAMRHGRMVSATARPRLHCQKRLRTVLLTVLTVSAHTEVPAAVLAACGMHIPCRWLAAGQLAVAMHVHRTAIPMPTLPSRCIGQHSSRMHAAAKPNVAGMPNAMLCHGPKCSHMGANAVLKQAAASISRPAIQ